MRKGDRRGVKMGMLIMVLAALFLLTSPMFLQTQIWGLGSDDDGFADIDEQKGITLMCSKEPNDTDYTESITFPHCQPWFPEDQECVDINKDDLFVILKRREETLIPRPGDPNYDPSFDFFELIRNIPSGDAPPGYKGDYGLRVNVIDVLAIYPYLEDCDDEIIKRPFYDYEQGAVKIVESGKDPNGLFGNSPWTNPDNSGAIGQVYTQGIHDYVTEYCSYASECKDHDTDKTNVDDIIRIYIRHTLCHEIAHLLKLRKTLDKTLQAHYGTEGKTILERHVVVTSKGPAGRPRVEFFITNDFTDEDFYSVKLTN